MIRHCATDSAESLSNIILVSH